MEGEKPAKRQRSSISVCDWTSRAQTAYEAGDITNSLELFSEALQLAERGQGTPAEHAIALEGRSKCHLAFGDHVSALIDANAALKLQPQLDSARLRRAEANESRGQYDDAIDDLRIVHAHDNSNEAVSEIIQRILRKVHGTSSRKLSQAAVDNFGMEHAEGSWVWVEPDAGIEIVKGVNFERDLPLHRYWKLHGGPKQHHCRIDKYVVYEIIELKYHEQRAALYSLFEQFLAGQLQLQSATVYNDKILCTEKCWNTLMRRYGLLTTDHGLDQLLSWNVKECANDTPFDILESILMTLIRIVLVREYVNAYSEWREVQEAGYFSGVLKGFKSFPLVGKDFSFGGSIG